VRYAVTLPESAILFSTIMNRLVGGGGARGVKITIGGNGASVCLRFVAFFEVFVEADICARKNKIKKLAGNSSAGPPTSGGVDLMNPRCLRVGGLAHDFSRMPLKQFNRFNT
jgi:hypothetical protein